MTNTITIHETPENRRRARDAIEAWERDPFKRYRVQRATDDLINAVLAAMAEPRKEPGEWR